MVRRMEIKRKTKTGDEEISLNLQREIKTGKTRSREYKIEIKM